MLGYRVAFLFTIALVAAPLTSQAQGVTLRCGGGTVPTNGFIINGQGEVVFGEQTIACNVPVSPGLPDPLVLSILQPVEGTSINVSNDDQNVGFVGQVTNYTAGVDSCQVQVHPPAPATAWLPVTLAPNGSGGVSTNLEFPEGTASGIYNIRLSCTRVSNNQQVVVNPVSRAITVVNEITPPPGCASAPIPSIFTASSQTVIANYTDPYQFQFTPCGNDPGEGGFGAPPNTSVCARNFSLTNRLSGGVLTGVQLRSWKFRPTANTTVNLDRGNGSSLKNVLSISECPGQYSNLPAKCVIDSFDIYWTTRTSDAAGACLLDPTKDYYINAASFDLQHFQATGLFQPGPQGTCAGSNCSVTGIWKVQAIVQ